LYGLLSRKLRGRDGLEFVRRLRSWNLRDVSRSDFMHLLCRRLLFSSVCFDCMYSLCRRLLFRRPSIRKLHSLFGGYVLEFDGGRNVDCMLCLSRGQLLGDFGVVMYHLPQWYIYSRVGCLCVRLCAL